jgi:hypothetical protein
LMQFTKERCGKSRVSKNSGGPRLLATRCLSTRIQARPGRSATPSASAPPPTPLPRCASPAFDVVAIESKHREHQPEVNRVLSSANAATHCTTSGSSQGVLGGAQFVLIIIYYYLYFFLSILLLMRDITGTYRSR